jgi:hypothetical protein
MEKKILSKRAEVAVTVALVLALVVAGAALSTLEPEETRLVIGALRGQPVAQPAQPAPQPVDYPSAYFAGMTFEVIDARWVRSWGEYEPRITLLGSRPTAEAADRVEINVRFLDERGVIVETRTTIFTPHPGDAIEYVAECIKCDAEQTVGWSYVVDASLWLSEEARLFRGRIPDEYR